MQSNNAAVEGDASKAALLIIVKMVAPIIMEKVMQVPVFVCKSSIVNGVVENVYIGKVTVLSYTYYVRF